MVGMWLTRSLGTSSVHMLLRAIILIPSIALARLGKHAPPSWAMDVPEDSALGWLVWFSCIYFPEDIQTAWILFVSGADTVSLTLKQIKRTPQDPPSNTILFLYSEIRDRCTWFQLPLIWSFSELPQKREEGGVNWFISSHASVRATTSRCSCVLVFPQRFQFAPRQRGRDSCS